MRAMAAVTFDLWHTLVKELPGSTERVSDLRIRRIAEVLECAGRQHTTGEIDEAYRKTGAFLEQTWGKARDLPAKAHIVFMLDQVERGLSGTLDPEDLAKIEKTYAEAMLEHPPILVDGAERVLSELRCSGYMLGLISNTGKTPGTTLRTLLDRMGVLSHFEATTFSDETTVRKPEKAIFMTTLDRLNTHPAATAHVGDDPRKDVEGARACGMRAIQVAWPGVPRSPQADLFASTLAEVPDAICELEKGLSAAQGVHSR